MYSDAFSEIVFKNWNDYFVYEIVYCNNMIQYLNEKFQ